MTICCEKTVEVDKDLIPTGNLVPVDGTFLDLRKPVRLADVLSKCPGGEFSGFSHCYVVEKNICKDDNNFATPKKKLVSVAEVRNPTTGITLKCFTDQPGLIFYTGQYNSNEGTMIGRCGKVYGKYSGLCLETQKFGDSCNKPDFPTWTLRPGQVYTHNSEYNFSSYD